MILKGIIDEDFVNYRVPSMTLMFPLCTFKCGVENCQNKSLIDEPDIQIDAKELCERYVNNPITKAIVFQGLEPFDSYAELIFFIATLRRIYNCYDDIVIYTGYTKDEVMANFPSIMNDSFGNVIIKYGRYVPGNTPHFDPILGVKLASNNQYAERINDNE